MRLFPYILCCLAILLIASACGKSSIDDSIVGKWKLVSYSSGWPPNPRPLGPGFEVLTLRHDHNYEIKYKDTVISSGTYHVRSESNPPQSILYSSSQEDYGSRIS